ncbi:MAG: hypothetical protein J0H44_13535 [Alphaproteobacteria bacterium]|nr:hypothetical protein [Alphaproteobacteria bacterium]
MEIDIGVPKKQPNGGNETGISAGDSTEGATASGPPNTAMSSFDSFADLHDVVRPEGAAEQALVAGYWLQICQKAESFDGQAANKELKNLGHGVANITKAIDGLKNQSPALALQLKKSGTSKQARKLYKITVAGQKVIEEKIKAQSNG